MAYANSSGAARPTHVHPQATPGYGKRSAPEQEPRRAGGFAHLPAREALIAAFVDRLPEGAAMDAKTLAANIPAYGQAACRTAIRRLAEAGHLRMVKEHRKGDGGSMHWVTRTYFSRTARGDAWWEAFLRGDVVPEARHEPPARSEAYDALASLGRTDPRMTLSAATAASWRNWPRSGWREARRRRTSYANSRRGCPRWCTSRAAWAVRA
ncbi:hypothetical protein [Streptomyces sp. NPDC001719]